MPVNLSVRGFKNGSKRLILLLLFLIVTCQPYSVWHGGDITGRILDSDGNPKENVFVMKSVLALSPDSGAVFPNPMTQKDSVHTDLTDFSGRYFVPGALGYMSSSEPNQFGCTSNDAFTKVINTYLGVVEESYDTTIILFADPDTSVANNWMAFAKFADTVIFLEEIYFDYYDHPVPYELPDIILK